MPSFDAVTTPLILAISWLLATLAVRSRLRLAGFETGIASDLSWWLVLGALGGARLGYVLGHWPLFLAYPQDIVLTIWNGLSFFGGLVGAIVAGLLFARRQGLPAAVLAGAVAPAIPLGIGLARIGFLVYSMVALGSLSIFGGLSGDFAADWLEALVCLGLFVSTSHPSKSHHPESPFLSALIGYGLLRAMVDLLRPAPTQNWLFSDQALALGLAIVGMVIVALTAKRQHIDKAVSSPSEAP